MKRIVIVIGAVLVVVVLGGALLTGRIPGVPLRGGPLDSASVDLKMPVPADVEGVFWGVLELQNTTGSDIVFDSVELDENPDGVRLLSEPYIWDDGRYEILKTGGIAIERIPLPAKWKNLPPKRKVHGFVMTSGSTREPAQIADVVDEEREYDGPSPEFVFELAKPEKAATIRGITLRYHVGWLAYQRTFDMSVTICPPTDPDPCHADSRSLEPE